MSNKTARWFFITQDHKSKIILSTYDNLGRGWSSCSAPYNSKKKLRDDCGILPNPCKHCGQMVKTSYAEEMKKILTENNLCFSCNFWFDLKETLNDLNRFVVNYIAYRVHPDPPKGYGGFLGFGGAEFKFKRPNGEVTISHNTWCNGTVPESFYELIPDNAILI